MYCQRKIRERALDFFVDAFIGIFIYTREFQYPTSMVGPKTSILWKQQKKKIRFDASKDINNSM